MDRENNRRTILIIDDDDEFSVAIRHVLESHGYDVCRAADGDEGLQLIKRHAPDVVILDFMMPVKTGFDVCHDIREASDIPDTPIVALTAFGQNIGELHGLENAEDTPCIREFLEKPVEPNVLLERVEAALGG